jgi:purine-nucleoside phosphorylase
MSAFSDFAAVVRDHAPRTAVVLGSGLGSVTTGFAEVASLPATTGHGHRGRIAVGRWHGTPAVVFLGRLHFYEGHSETTVTTPVRVAGDLGVRRLILTNAAGGVHPSLRPGSLMAIRGHIKLVGGTAWRSLAAGASVRTPYSARLLEQMPGLLAGVYAALTGPCYETPAEIRAMAACGADAVGMSTAMEAEAAAELGMEIAAISCVTNCAAGLGTEALNHAEVLVNAKLAVEHLAELLTKLIKVPS